MNYLYNYDNCEQRQDNNDHNSVSDMARVLRSGKFKEVL